MSFDNSNMAEVAQPIPFPLHPWYRQKEIASQKLIPAAPHGQSLREKFTAKRGTHFKYLLTIKYFIATPVTVEASLSFLLKQKVFRYWAGNINYPVFIFELSDPGK